MHADNEHHATTHVIEDAGEPDGNPDSNRTAKSQNDGGDSSMNSARTRDDGHSSSAEPKSMNKIQSDRLSAETPDPASAKEEASTKPIAVEQAPVTDHAHPTEKIALKEAPIVSKHSGEPGGHPKKRKPNRKAVSG